MSINQSQSSRTKASAPWSGGALNVYTPQMTLRTSSVATPDQDDVATTRSSTWTGERIVVEKINGQWRTLTGGTRVRRKRPSSRKRLRRRKWLHNELLVSQFQTRVIIDTPPETELETFEQEIRHTLIDHFEELTL